MIEHETWGLQTDHERLKIALELNITEEKLHGMETALGPEGNGTFLIPEVLDDGQVGLVQEEIFDPFCVPWRDNHNVFVNGRGLTIVENHDVFALKTQVTDQPGQRWLERVPRLTTLMAHIEELIRLQSRYFPALAGWKADELSLHRYDDPEVGLSRHRDNLRYIGLIAVLTLEGASDFDTWNEAGRHDRIAVKAGDLVLNRATGLYHMPHTKDGKKVNLCPDHAVVNLRTSHRTSLILRDNSKPAYALQGFEYENWVGIPEPEKAA